MSLVTTFLHFIQPLSSVMTRPTYESLVTILTGWVFSRRRTITAALVAADAIGSKHHSAFHRVFATARWSLDELGLVVFRLMLPLIGDAVVGLVIDDTLVRKRGTTMFGCGMHHDPLASTRSVRVLGFGHSWVVLCVAVRLPFMPDKVFSLPILFRLYLNKKGATRFRRTYRTRPQLAVELLKLMCARHSTRKFYVVADSAYGGESVLGRLPRNCDLTSRLALNARLYTAPAPRKPGTNGRPRVRGTRLPSPKEMLDQRGTRHILNLYGRRDRVRVVTAVAAVHHVPGRLLRIVVVEPLRGGRDIQAFFSTCVTDAPLVMLTRYASRWSIEETFQASKTQLGFEQPQGWTRLAVLRTAPTVMLLYSLVVMWFAQWGKRKFRIPLRPWYVGKRQPSFADMLATLKRESWKGTFSKWLPKGSPSRKVLRSVDIMLATPA